MPLGPSDLFDLKFLRDGRLSPDGRLTAFVVSSVVGEEERFDLWTRALDERAESAARLPYTGNATWPRWSPDGKHLAFVGDGRLYVWEFGNAPPRPITPEDRTVQGAASWSPDGQALAVSLLERRSTPGARRITKAHYRAEGIGFIDHLAQRVVVAAKDGGWQRQISDDSTGMASQPEWSPGGRHVLFLETENAVPGSSYSPRLVVVGVEDGIRKVVLDYPWFIASARWMPDGQRIAVAGCPDTSLTIPNSTVWVVDLEGNAQWRTPNFGGKIGALIHHDMPAWDLTRGNGLLVVDDQTILATFLHRGRTEIWRVAADGPARYEVVLSGERSCIALDARSQTNTLLFAETSLHSPTELCLCSLDGQDERRLSALNDSVLREWPEMQVEEFWFQSPDGYEIQAWFLRAAGAEGSRPTVMFIHGGPFASTGHAFRYDFHLLASNGFGVLFANFRGSAGYGDAFSRAIMGDWGARAYPDHIGAIDAAIDRGWSDPQRLGVWGPSHGGFATCWLVGHTTRFKAAVAEAAVTNFTSKYYLTDAPETVARDLGGKPHEIPDVYRSRSPITYAHRCVTPTMLIHGEDDLRCPIGEAEQFYRALVDAGCPTELVRIPNCNHMGDSSGPIAARRAQNEALLEWFSRYL